MFVKSFKLYVVVFLIGITQYFSAAGAENIEAEGKWNKPGIPHKGWTHQGVEDLKDITGVCEMCDKKRIRYLHTVNHDEWEDLVVGRDCAEKMCNDYENPKKREGKAKGEARKREAQAKREAQQRQIAAIREVERVENLRRAWLDISQWRQTPKGGYSKKIEEEWLNIFRQGNNWKYVFRNQFSMPYPNIEEVLQATYDQYFIG